MAEDTETSRGVGPVTLSTGAAAALTTCACWILEANGISVPTEVQGAFTVLTVFIAGALVPGKRGKRAA